ncbi:MAG: SpoVR family protein, partial [Syntrophomonas sp.]
SVREQERDSSFIRRFLSLKLCKELNLFEYGKRARDFIVNEVADEEGWRSIRNSLANNVGIQAVPNIKVMEVKGKNNILILEHEWEGRELQLEYAHETLKHIANLWRGKVQLRTMVRSSNQILETDGD